MRRILVTGGAGFIGFHVLQALKQQGDIVLGLDNFNDYYPIQLKEDRSQILNQQGISIRRVDLASKADLKEVIESFNPTHVIHLAAQAGVRYSLQNPDAYIQSNIVGFTNLLEILKEKPTIPLIYASSSSVYGNSPQTPFKESQPTDTPMNLYGATKKANELMAYAYHSLYGLKTIGLRFFTVYGPWGRPDMAYYFFSQKILDEQPIPIYEGARIQRDFTYIDDIVDGILKSLDCEDDYEVFNLGNHTPVLLNDFISTLEDVLGKKAIRDYQPRAKGDMEITYADLTKSEKKLNFRPKTQLKEGLTAFAHWFLEYHLLQKEKTAR